LHQPFLSCAGFENSDIVDPTLLSKLAPYGRHDAIFNYAALIIGGTILGFASAVLGNLLYCSPRRALQATAATMVLGLVLQVTSGNLEEFYMARFVSSLAFGAIARLGPSFVEECVARQHRTLAVASLMLNLASHSKWREALELIKTNSVSDRCSRTGQDDATETLGMILHAARAWSPFEILTGTLFLVGMCFVPESPWYIACRDLESRSRPRNQPADEKTPLREWHTSDASVTSPSRYGTTSFTQAHESLSAAAIITLAQLRGEPMLSAAVQAEMADIYEELEQNKDARAWWWF